jgi:hypothetical protein
VLAVSAIAIPVEPLANLKRTPFVPDVDPIFTEPATRILLVANFGVMLAISPVISTKVADVVENTSVKVTLTTCSTVPYG